MAQRVQASFPKISIIEEDVNPPYSEDTSTTYLELCKFIRRETIRGINILTLTAGMRSGINASVVNYIQSAYMNHQACNILIIAPGMRQGKYIKNQIVRGLFTKANAIINDPDICHYHYWNLQIDIIKNVHNIETIRALPSYDHVLVFNAPNIPLNVFRQLVLPFSSNIGKVIMTAHTSYSSEGNVSWWSLLKASPNVSSFEEHITTNEAGLDHRQVRINIGNVIPSTFIQPNAYPFRFNITNNQ